MKSDFETLNQPYEYVVQIDGNVESRYRLFVDALKAGLQLKQLHPHCDVRVRDANEQSPTAFSQGTGSN